MFEKWEQLHIAIAGWSLKTLLTVGMSGGGAIGVAIGQMITNQWGAAGLSGVIAAGLMSGLLVIPKIMEQRRKARESNASIKDGITERIINFYELQLAAAGEQITFHQIAAAERDIIASIERKSKHDVLEQLNNADLVIKDCQFVLRMHAIVHDIPYQFKTYKDMCGEQDERVDESKRKISDAITPGILRPLVRRQLSEEMERKKMFTTPSA